MFTDAVGAAGRDDGVVLVVDVVQDGEEHRVVGEGAPVKPGDWAKGAVAW